jgi:hypothetical protein
MVMRTATLPLLLVTALSAFAAEPASNQPYKQEYKKQTFGKKAVIVTGARAGIGQITGRPKGWGQGPAGFGKRVASGFATHVVKNTIEYPIAAIRHEDLRYHPSTKRGFAPRLEHALVSTVVTQKTTTGKKTVASGRISGAIGSGLISRAWQPAAARSVGAGLTSGGITLGGQAAANVAQEFWPRHKKYYSAANTKSKSAGGKPGT